MQWMASEYTKGAGGTIRHGDSKRNLEIDGLNIYLSPNVHFFYF